MHTRSLMIDRPFAMAPSEAMAVIGGGETKDNNHPDINPLCQTEVLKAIGVRSPTVSSRSSQSDCIQMVLGICMMRQETTGGNSWMKIKLPIFKDEDAKDAVTYQSWRWDLTVYRSAGCRDHTLLAICHQILTGLPRQISVEFRH